MRGTAMWAVRMADKTQMSEDEWREVRRRGIGGADVAAIVGLHPWKSAVEVWAEKVGLAAALETSQPAEWGRRLEDVIARHFAEAHGCRVRRVNAVLQHPVHSVLLANIDRLVHGVNGAKEAVLEIKTSSARLAELCDDDRVPDWVVCQVQHYLNVTGLEKAYVAALIGGNRYVEREIQRDEELIEQLEQMTLAWWERHVAGGVPPEPDGSAASSEVLRRLYPTVERPAVDLPDEAEALIREYEEAARAEKEAAERKEAAANRLKALLGDAEIGRIGGVPRVRWSVVQQTRLDTGALKQAYPAVYQECSRTSTYRRFCVLRAGDAHAA